ncbi:hypothetical protein STAS_31249 [Striga asiatica]|uniref:WPP domain-associated protein n=1 Tax=Striga asiatica TaxID=4170 RepID=A0A5A7R7I9_STRAF|nr:hypothetical protein STAS_31249 [Striga asiatica]
MEDIFGQIECRTKSDSVVMRILRSAMDEAHEKLQSRDGPIQFLHDRSTFYELAAILVEGGLSIVRDEKTDDMAANCNKIHSDLTEIKSWLAGRIQDMRHLILEKDRELTDLSEKSLELKEREAACRAENEDIFRLKDSVDQQVSSMKQKLDEERRALIIERRNKKTRVSSPNLSFEFLDKERNGSPIFKDDVDFDIDIDIPGMNVKKPNNQNVLIRKMSSDIDILKETLDLAFGRIGTIPFENQWACSVERDVELTLVRGFLDDLRRGPLAGPNDWMEFVDELRNLCRELRDYVKTNDMHEKRRPVIARSSSEPVSDIEFTGDNNSDFDEVDGKKHVAKMKKNFESIIKKQVEELSRLKREGGEGSFSRIGREKGGSRLERRIRDAIMRLENLTKRDQLKKSRSFNFKPTDHVRANRSSINEVKRLKFEVERVKEERDELFFENFVMQDTYRVLLRCVTSDFREIFEACTSEKDDFATECLLRDDIYRFLILEAAKDSCVAENQENVSNADIFREGSLIRKFDSLLKCLEAEEDLMLRANSEIKEHNVSNSLVILNCEEIDERDAIEWLITDDECTFISVSEKLERALQQLYTSKELLVELEQSLKVSEESEEFCCRGLSSDVECGKGSSVISYNGVLGNIVELLGVVGNFEHALGENVESKCLRIQSLKHDVELLAETVNSVGKQKLLYKKAFVSRCQSLMLAEAEVDLLGDQVETLLCLLERIYFELNQNAKVFSAYFQVIVYDTLKLIKRELKDGRPCRPKS